MKEYFEILEISETASDSDIKNAYRQLAKKYHPDVNHSKNAQEKFIAITEAYEFLINQRSLKDKSATIQMNQEPTATNYQAKKILRGSGGNHAKKQSNRPK